jgi:hypothetical protein
MASGALASEPAAGHAAHALTHAFYEMNQHNEGLRWLQGWIDSNSRTAFMPSSRGMPPCTNWPSATRQPCDAAMHASSPHRPTQISSWFPAQRSG